MSNMGKQRRCGCATLASGAAAQYCELRCALLVPHKGTALHAAAAAGDVAAAEALLLEGASVDARDAAGSTALHAAAASDAPSAPAVAELLLHAGADVALLANDLGLTPLHACACQPSEASLAVLHLLLRAGADATAEAQLEDCCWEPAAGETALALAAQHAAPGLGAAAFIRALLAAGGDALRPSKCLDATPLELACATGDAEVVHLLLEAAPKSNWYKQTGIDAGYLLRLAVAYGHEEVVSLLLDPPPHIRAILMQPASPPDPTSVLDGEGSSLSAAEEASFQASCNDPLYDDRLLDAALADAVRSGNLALVRLLVPAGANASCFSGTSRLFELHQEHMAALGARGRFPLLHKLDALRSFWETPVILALREGHDDIVTWLLKRASPLPVPDDLNRTALHWAAILGKNELLRLMLETGMFKQELRGCGRVLDLRDKDDWSALACALHYRNAGAVALLVAHGADIDGHVTTRSGWMRPINAALCFPRSSEEQPALLEVLLEHGARPSTTTLELAAELAERGMPAALEVLQSWCDAASA